VGWEAVLAYVDALPPHLADHPLVLEQRSLALAKTGDVARSAGTLEEIIARHGPTPERYGLLGGRFKQLHRHSSPADGEAHLQSAIENYERGMLLDLNGYYCAGNLPRLYLDRAAPGDRERAERAAAVALHAADRAIALRTDDGWARATKLGVAFTVGDLATARALRDEVRREGSARWQLESTLSDLRVDVGRHAGVGVREGLQEIVDELQRLVDRA
jgi:hypothetical protein